MDGMPILMTNRVNIVNFITHKNGTERKSIIANGEFSNRNTLIKRKIICV